MTPDQPPSRPSPVRSRRSHRARADSLTAPPSPSSLRALVRELEEVPFPRVFGAPLALCRIEDAVGIDGSREAVEELLASLGC